MLSKSGFAWNPVMKMVECSDEVWTTYVAANPDAKGLRGKKIDMLDELAIVCGNDYATREWANSAKDINAKKSKPMNDTGEEYTPLVDLNEEVNMDDLDDAEENYCATE
ncbi:uncharacterized protein LOC132269018 [Cornus florida]|uniref:uncharacterized protein LOC132269018 n=1 Tax=Cornus florida TaxID=4283 RepID=UPI00289DB050|nr:uncharacterized protein LOC132269018 [Cornus florida]